MAKKSQKSIKKPEIKKGLRPLNFPIRKEIKEIKQREVPLPKKEGREDKERHLYVYGIVNKKDAKLGAKGLKTQPIEKIDFKDISALITPYPVLHPILNEEEVMYHAEILKKIAFETAVVPMSFGTVFKDQEILEVVLDKSYQAIKKTLALIKNKIELGVKVVKKPLEENQLEEQPDGMAQEILEALTKLSVKSVQGDKFSERLLLNNSFLVEKNNFPKFSEEIANLEEKYPDLKFLYTGPWPAYSFVNINIKGS